MNGITNLNLLQLQKGLKNIKFDGDNKRTQTTETLSLSLVRDVYLWISINKEYMVHHPHTADHITSHQHTLNYMAQLSQHSIYRYNIHISISL